MRPPRDETGSKAYSLLRAEVHGREQGLCVRCGRNVALRYGECHHRKLRSRGGRDTAFNCIWLCTACHVHVHGNPAESTALGFLVPSWEDPSDWPVRRDDGRYYQPKPALWVQVDRRDEQNPARWLNAEDRRGIGAQ